MIPDDEGILYIGAFAFAHYEMDHKKEVEKDENGYYDLDEKKTPLGNHTVTSVVIPEGVETIKKYAFYNCTALKSVTLPESCNLIEKSAFEMPGETELVDVNFDNVKIIADRAFANCTKLSCQNLGGIASSGIYAVGEYAFGATALTSLELNGLSRISPRAFADCKSLTTVVLGDRTRVSEGMFENSAITSIVIKSDTVGNRAFKGCTSLTSVTFDGDLTYLGVEALSGCTALSSVTINGQLEQIAENAFNGCTSLTSLALPNGNVIIGNNAFASSALAQLVFKANTYVEAFGSSVFPNTEFDVDVSASTYYKEVGGAIYNMAGDVLILVLPTDAKEFTVAKEVTHIASGAFTAAKMLETLNFEENSALASIGDSAFTNSTTLVTVNLPANNITIGAYAFDGATALSSIDLSKVTSIGKYAFSNTLLTEATIGENVVIGAYAFKNTSALETLSLGNNVTIGEGAFEASALVSAELAGDAKIGTGAFKNCAALTSFDFADVTGTIGNYAFYGCTSLTSVVAPKIEKIGDGSFAGCTMLATLSADNLVSIGNGAFFDMELIDQPEVLSSTVSNRLLVLNLPKLESVGEYAFTMSNYLRSATLPELKTIGQMSFALCQNLATITYSDELTVVPSRAFYACQSLTNFDFTNIEHIGSAAFYGVKLPKNLVLPNLVSLDTQAFVEYSNTLESVEAPKLVSIGEQAFAGCAKLRRITAPLVESIGDYAFVGTTLVEFGVGDNLKTLGRNPFIMCEDFEEFYYLEDGVKVYDKELANVMIKDGVLYTKNARGYSLYCYPTAKADTTLDVAEGTTRIEYQALYMNKNIETVTFPSSLRTISDFAFYGCENLTNVTFKSYYAPVLESYLSIAQDEPTLITVDNVEQFPGFDDLYKYNYSFVLDGWTSRNYYNANFKAGVGSEKAVKMSAVIPENSSGYDSILYNAYFNIAEDQNSGTAPGKYALAFIEAVYRLPENVDRFDRLLVEEAINAYNALAAHVDEKAYIDDATVAKFERLCTEYNVDVVEGKIARLFGMYNNEYSFNILKDATLSYLALTEEERAMVETADVLEAKKVELALAMGVVVDFSKTYNDHFAKEEGPTEPPTDDKKDNKVLIVVIIIIASLAVAGGAGAAVFFFLKKKNQTSPSSDEKETEKAPETENTEETAEEVVEETTEETVVETVEETTSEEATAETAEETSEEITSEEVTAEATEETTEEPGFEETETTEVTEDEETSDTKED